MSAIECREADLADVDELARIRAAEWGTQPYWQTRISGYMRGQLHPRESLPPRVVLLASANDIILGFIAGHLTRRFGCDGEVEWLNVIPARRRTGVAAALFHALATWFGTRQARRVCVDVNPHNAPARAFYRHYGAQDLNPHWLVWPDCHRRLQITQNRREELHASGIRRGA